MRNEAPGLVSISRSDIMSIPTEMRVTFEKGKKVYALFERTKKGRRLHGRLEIPDSVDQAQRDKDIQAWYDSIMGPKLSR